ncbi:MAG TPA: hypothetical protein VFA50_14680 [Stellaceae bacterium]|nr:hypothetical protein [Stellaceae bacterium]
MRDASDSLNAYLGRRFGLSLERLLADATAKARCLPLGPAIEIVCDPVGAFSYEDGGASEQYQGLLTVEGATYRFRCSVFTDAGGARYIEDLGAFEPIRWAGSSSASRNATCPK